VAVAGDPGADDAEEGEGSCADRSGFGRWAEEDAPEATDRAAPKSPSSPEVVVSCLGTINGSSVPTPDRRALSTGLTR
jgi:hypothetical protein